jgi:phosphomethylpyrimidine synthase
MSIILDAKKGVVSPDIRTLARDEGVSVEHLVSGIIDGTIVIPHNKLRKLRKPCGIGRGLRTKVNANIGTSTDVSDIELELQKLQVSIDAGADTVMDLSTGGNPADVRRIVLAKSAVPVGTVPIYDVIVKRFCSRQPLKNVAVDDFFMAIENHVKSGVDFITVHCGLTKKAVEVMFSEGRVMDVVSRGGAFLVEWMTDNEQENPLYEYYNRLLEIAVKYDVTLSLGDGMRPGSIVDATDRAQIEELITLGELAKRALAAGVQTIIEGPGHVPLNEVAENIRLQKSLCGGAPFYVLGPLVTDCAPGYDHITAAIGGAIAAAEGADFLCYVTPAEHLRLPTVEDVREGVIASKIAAHAGDIVKGVKGARERDLQMSKARKKRDWKKQVELALDPVKAQTYRESSMPKQDDVCTMCGDVCSMKMIDEVHKKAKKQGGV